MTSVSLTNALRIGSIYLSASTGRTVATLLPSKDLIASSTFSGTSDEIVIVGNNIGGGTATILGNLSYSEII